MELLSDHMVRPTMQSRRRTLLPSRTGHAMDSSTLVPTGTVRVDSKRTPLADIFTVRPLPTSTTRWPRTILYATSESNGYRGLERRSSPCSAVPGIGRAISIQTCINYSGMHDRCTSTGGTTKVRWGEDSPSMRDALEALHRHPMPLTVRKAKAVAAPPAPAKPARKKRRLSPQGRARRR